MDFDGGDGFYVDFGGSHCDMDLYITEARLGRFSPAANGIYQFEAG